MKQCSKAWLCKQVYRGGVQLLSAAKSCTTQPQKVITSKLPVSQENFCSGTWSDKIKFFLGIGTSYLSSLVINHMDKKHFAV